MRPVRARRRASPRAAIRAHLEAGEVARAAALLGRPPRSRASSSAGDARGGTLGFPTANLGSSRTCSSRATGSTPAARSAIAPRSRSASTRTTAASSGASRRSCSTSRATSTASGSSSSCGSGCGTSARSRARRSSSPRSRATSRQRGRPSGRLARRRRAGTARFPARGASVAAWKASSEGRVRRVRERALPRVRHRLREAGSRRERPAQPGCPDCGYVGWLAVDLPPKRAPRRSAPTRIRSCAGPRNRADAAEVVVPGRPAPDRPSPPRASRAPSSSTPGSTCTRPADRVDARPLDRGLRLERSRSRIALATPDERGAQPRAAGRADREREPVGVEARASAPSCSHPLAGHERRRGPGRPRRACCSGAGRGRGASRRSRARGSSSTRRRRRPRRRPRGSSCARRRRPARRARATSATTRSAVGPRRGAASAASPAHAESPSRVKTRRARVSDRAGSRPASLVRPRSARVTSAAALLHQREQQLGERAAVHARGALLGERPRAPRTSPGCRRSSPPRAACRPASRSARPRRIVITGSSIRRHGACAGGIGTPSRRAAARARRAAPTAACRARARARAGRRARRARRRTRPRWRSGRAPSPNGTSSSHELRLAARRAEPGTATKQSRFRARRGARPQ